MSSISDQLTSILFVFGIIHATKHLDLTNPETILWVRLVYIASQCLLYALAFYVKYRIRTINDTSKVQVTIPPKPFSEESPKVVEMTVTEYDLERVGEFIRQTTVSLCILMFMHYKWDFIQPLIIQSILPLKAAIFLPIFQIHLLKRPAEGGLKRPFKPPTSPLSEWAEQLQQQSSAPNSTTDGASQKDSQSSGPSGSKKTLPLPTKKSD